MLLFFPQRVLAVHVQPRAEILFVWILSKIVGGFDKKAIGQQKVGLQVLYGKEWTDSSIYVKPNPDLCHTMPGNFFQISYILFQPKKNVRIEPMDRTNWINNWIQGDINYTVENYSAITGFYSKYDPRKK